MAEGGFGLCERISCMSSETLRIRPGPERSSASKAVAYHIRSLFGSRDRTLLNTTSFSTLADDARLHQFLAALCIKHGLIPTTVVSKYAE
jgi:hypothetical protein